MEVTSPEFQAAAEPELALMEAQALARLPTPVLDQDEPTILREETTVLLEEQELPPEVISPVDIMPEGVRADASGYVYI